MSTRSGSGAITLFKFFPDWFYRALHVDHRLAEGMAWHFTFMWFFAINGLLYVAYTFWSGEWRQLVPNRHTFAEAWQVVLHDLGIRKQPLPRRKFNGAQRLAYTGVIAMGAGSLLTGLAIYKPVQLAWLATLLGGYPLARLEHFVLAVGYVAVLRHPHHPGHPRRVEQLPRDGHRRRGRRATRRPFMEHAARTEEADRRASRSIRTVERRDRPDDSKRLSAGSSRRARLRRGAAWRRWPASAAGDGWSRGATRTGCPGRSAACWSSTSDWRGRLSGRRASRPNSPAPRPGCLASTARSAGSDARPGRLEAPGHRRGRRARTRSFTPRRDQGPSPGRDDDRAQMHRGLERRSCTGPAPARRPRR